MKRSLLLVSFLIVCSLYCNIHAVIPDVQFRRIEVSDGLSNSQINCIFKDSRGFMWFGTASGLNRYDGFRFVIFYTSNDKKQSIPSNNVNTIKEDFEGKLWINTNSGYVIYNPVTESFDRNIKAWMISHGMNGEPDRVIMDKEKNMWLSIYGKGCYFYDIKKNKKIFFTQGKKGLPKGQIIAFSECKDGMIASYNDGTFVCLDGLHRRLLWVNRHIPQSGGGKNQTYNIFVDSHDNYWIYTLGKTFVYMSKTNEWVDNLSDFAAKTNMKAISNVILTRDIKEDRQGRVWIVTDHSGLVVVDYVSHSMRAFVNDKKDPRSIQDNTLQSIYIDNDGTVWVGTYKNGVAYYSECIYKFRNIGIGDICTITEDRQGNYWCGSNDSGIVVYNPITHSLRKYTSRNSALQSDVVVSSCCASDGSIWFGTYNGGLTHYHNGIFTTYRKQSGGLANDNIWSIVEDKNGNIWIGTLGSGVQMLNPNTGIFTTYNIANTGMTSDYVASLCWDCNGNLVVGHSGNFSVMNIRSKKFTHYKSTRSGKSFSDPSVQQIFVDSRGLIWDGTCSGVNVYDPKTDQLKVIDINDGLYGSLICSIIEDRDHSIWLASGTGISNVKVKKNGGRWRFKVYSYNDKDGLQARQFNQRSIFMARDGKILIGGQDGVDIVDSRKIKYNHINASTLFSELMLFDHPVDVGEEYNGRVILKRALNESRELKLEYSENVFSIEFASSNYNLPEKTRFKYKLEGFNDQWFVTSETQHNVSFTNLAPGTYTLYVKVINGDGFESSKVSILKIVITPPFWGSVWAYILYIILIIAIIFYFYRISVRRQQNKFKIEQIRREAEKDHEVDEMKLRFFTNVSHELRTPLTLIVSPLMTMIKEENDDHKRQMLMMIHRNAARLLSLVNQLLDFRRNDVHGQQLNLLTGDIVSYVQNICNSFTILSDKKVSLTFFSAISSLRMSFDEDKIGKVVSNLLSNAFKFTPNGGRVDVSLRILSHSDDKEILDVLELKVSDTGIGIPDEDKKRIFDRFYQVENQKVQSTGGSGLGLNLVKEFVDMHKGKVHVENNPGGGSVFIVLLPIAHDKRQAVMPYDIPLVSVNDDDSLNYNNEKEYKEKMSVRNKGKEYEVMIVDDSEDFLDFMGNILGENYNVILAHNGKEALDLIARHKPDIILSDVMMPEMDGNELCRCVKKNPETERIPFVMLTARLAEEHKIEGLENGADDYITKPFNLDLLNLRIINLIKWHNSAGVDGKIHPHIKEVRITSLDEKLVKNATDYVERNLSNSELSVEDLSSALNMSRVHLYKKLLSLTGNTPSEFIRLIRLRHAEQLLRQSQLSVSEISYQVGFNNPRYFSKYFKDMYGVIPSVYKDEKGK
jgi:signal transduction histidine kinase/ligand-binding sensor domain-containing protein/DNA-binding response OmpR family regulator